MYASFDVGERNLAFYVGTVDVCERWERVDVTACAKKRRTVVESCDAISERVLRPNDELWKKCDGGILIEQQITRNVRAQRIMQHVWTWFRTMYPSSTVVIVPSTLKTRHFTKDAIRDRKAWSIRKVRDILRDATVMMRILDDTIARGNKIDDLCDAYLQMFVYHARRVENA